MKKKTAYALPAAIALTVLSLVPLISVRVIWIDVLLLATGLMGLAFIGILSFRKTQRLNIQETFLKDRQNFELLVGSIRDYAIFLVDTGGRVASWNTGAENIKGFAAADIIGKPTALFYQEKDIRDGLPQINLQTALQLGHFQTEGWRLRKDRTAFYADIVITPLYDKEHNHYAYAVVTKDITRRKKTEATLLTLNNELEDRVIQKTAERVASEEKLSTGEEQFRRTLDNMLEGVQIHDRNWRYIYVNKALANHSQYSNTELLGHTLMEKYPGIEQTDLFKTLQRCMDDRLAMHFETQFIFPDGVKKDFQLSIQPVPEGLFILSIDITNRKKAEEKLISSEERREFEQRNLYALINNTTDLLWSVARDFTLITSNLAYEKMFTQLSGNDVQNGDTVLGDGFSAGQLQIFKAFYERAFAGESFTAEHSGFNGDTWSEVSFYPVYEGENVTGTACFSRDITERKIAEGLLISRLEEKKMVASRMQSILDTIPADIALLDDKGIIIEVNEAWRNGTASNHHTGNAYKVGDNYLERSKHISDEEPGDKKEIVKGLLDILFNNRAVFVHEYNCDAPEIKKCFRMVARPLLGKASAGAVVMHIDITDLRRLEQEKLASKIEQQKSITRAMLQAQEKERNHIGLELHDNVSQLLAATRMKLQIAVSGKEVNMAIVQQCILHVEETVVETRNLSHRMVMPRFADSSFLKALEELAVIYRIPSRIIHLATRDMDETIVCSGIKETLYRIAQEQLNNINKYAQATAISIRVATCNRAVVMEVSDNGVGFNTIKKKGGIGLVNIKNRSESYNGTAGIISSPGKGCRLIVDIPLQKAAPVAYIDNLTILPGLTA